MQPKGSTIGLLKDGKTVQQKFDSLDSGLTSLKGVTPESFSGTDTEQLLAAIAYAKSNSVNVYLMPGKTYTLTGTTSLEVDLRIFSFGTIMGRARIDATGFTGKAALWIHATGAYPDPMYQNTTNRVYGVELKGDITKSGVAGWMLGSDGKVSTEYNGQCCIEHCSVYNFDINILCTNDTWRYKFDKCLITSAKSYMFHAPAGLPNSGESITFHDCQFSDSKSTPINIECADFSVGMSGTSVLNTEIRVIARGAVVAMTDMCNIENPGASTWRKYVTVSNGGRFVIDNSTINCNQYQVQTRPIFSVDENSYIDFSNCRFPGNAYVFYQQNVDGTNTWVEGNGLVTATCCKLDLTSGAGCIPIHKSVSKVYNPDFEKGDTSGWSINNTGSASQTVLVDASYANSGSYGARFTIVPTRSLFLTQNCSGLLPARSFAVDFCARVVTDRPDGGNPGNLTLTFKSSNGTVIAGLNSNLTTGATDWTHYGKFLKGTVPRGAEILEISIRVQEGAVVDFDNITINFI
jgi:hypothetical protein